MAMHNPPHPGEFITAVYVEPNGLSGRELAAKPGVAPSALNRVLTGASGVSPEMALRLSMCLGRTPESWLAMQYSVDLSRRRRGAVRVGHSADRRGPPEGIWRTAIPGAWAHRGTIACNGVHATGREGACDQPSKGKSARGKAI
jgi:addiction module HigA family antidote